MHFRLIIHMNIKMSSKTFSKSAIHIKIKDFDIKMNKNFDMQLKMLY